MPKNSNELDMEWMKLVQEFMDSDVTKDEFRQFLELKKAEKLKRKD
ncbi:anti-repressor SinI family protein [Bacillus dakarensis]|nr:anti-repressor SinI family protein [Bacillus dakarensis]